MLLEFLVLEKRDVGIRKTTDSFQVVTVVFLQY